MKLYRRITVEKANELYPYEVSARGSQFVCELCAQNVGFSKARVDTGTRYFFHSSAEQNKECEDRQIQLSQSGTQRLVSLNSHVMPLRLVVTGAMFSLQLGFFYPPDSKAHCDKIKIAGDSHQVYEYSFERIERIGTTYLSVGSIPSQIYCVEYINANPELRRFWSNNIPGINQAGSFFDGRTGQILQSGGKAYAGNFYYLLQRHPIYTFPADSELLAEIATKQGELDRLLAEIQELAESIFPDNSLEDALHAVSVMLSIAPLARSESGSVLFPARMHMLFRGIKGVYACTNPDCPHSHTENGLTLGEVYFSDGNLTCKECGSTIYELYNDRRCGSIFFRGFVLKQDFEARRRTYLWHQPGMINEDEVKEIHLFIPSAGYRLPERQGQNKISPCYLDVQSGFIDFSDDSLDGKQGIRKLYYSGFTAKARPDILTFSTCPHCRHELSKMQLTSFNTRGNQSFFNLIKAQFQAQPAVPGKTGDPDRLPNEGRKVLLFSDSRQRAARQPII